MSLPNKFEPKVSEKLIQDIWETNETYKWDANSQTEPFIVDTPPPTVSGSLHLGHVFSYTQTDIVTRFQRMIGKNVFYPMGWDDNGLPTERRVQNFFGIKCNPNVKDQESFQLNYNFDPKKDQILEVSRKDFIAACVELTTKDEVAYEAMWRRLGLSVDWNETYSTINAHSQKISQLSFLDLATKNQVYNLESPTMWDVDFQSAIAQAELEDRERPGAFHDLKFQMESGEEFIIATTRPELLPACIAVVAHPSDERYQKFFGKTAITPLFHAPVPVLASEHAEPEKGSGMMMICTFGDINDVQWWKQSGLPIKQVINLQGIIRPITFGEDAFLSQNPDLANKNYQQLTGLYLKQAQKKIVELLASPESSVDGKSAALVGEPKTITHSVKFYEKGDRPLEFIPTRQWFIKTLDHKEALLEQGMKINWHPEHMRVRYENWVKGLNQDWCVSRQRYFGVPFPVWYPINALGEVNYLTPIYAEIKDLPVDPMSQVPPGYLESQRGQASGFVGDPDVMDTWATSSMTPQLASHWGTDEKRHKKLFPANIRPQAHEIIRTWAFYTIVKSWQHSGEIPWKDILISGWVLDPERKKMSKSKGNVITPETLFDEYSPDAIRYWTAKARLGADTAIEEAVFKMGGKLCTKIFNASKFVLMQFERIGLNIKDYNLSDVNCELDRALIANLQSVITESSKSLENFEYTTALKLIEDAFWDFCDNYLELVKVRSYQDEDNAERKSAMAALAWSLKTFLKLFAPYVPYVTEEVWQESFKDASHPAIHKSSWPTVDEANTVLKPSYAMAYTSATEVISKVRGVKTASQKSLKWEIAELNISCSIEAKQALESVINDLRQAANVKDQGLIFSPSSNQAGNLEITVILSESWGQ